MSFEAADRAIATLKKLGAQGLITHTTSRAVECEVREQKVEKLQDSQSAAMAVQIFVDGRWGAHATNDTRPKELDAFLGDAVKLTKLLDADPARSLPDPALFAPNRPLALSDAGYDAFTSEERKRWAKQLEQGARGDARVVSASGGFGDEQTLTVMVSSNGLRVAQPQTVYSGYTSVTVREGDKRPEGDWYAMGRTVKELGDAQGIGKTAMDRAIERIGATKLKSGEWTLLIENRAAGRLLGAFLGAANGQALQQKRSFLEGQQGKVVASKLLTLADDPAQGFGARSFDREGLRAVKLPVITAGVFENYYIDWYYAQKLKMKPTTGSTSTAVVMPGSESQQAMIGKVKSGIFVTSFIGGNSNSLTGDFSFGLQGRAIQDGKLTHAVAEMNLSGNHKTFWQKLTAVGNDPWRYGMLVPTLRIDGAAVSGA